MALVTYSPIVDQVAGSVGDTTFQTTAGGPVARQKTRTCTQQSPKQLAARSNLIEIAKAWQTLTDAEKEAWKNAALLQPYTNRVGRQRTLPGYQFFNQVNATGRAAGIGLQTSPPGSFTVPTLTTAGGLVVWTGSVPTNIELFWNETTPSTAIVLIEMTGRYSAGFTPDLHRLEQILTVPATSTPTALVGPAWAAVFGALPQQAPFKIHVRFTPIGATNAWKGCPINFLISVANPPPTPMPTPGATCSSAAAIAEATPYEYTASTSIANWFQLATTAGNTY